MNELKVSEHQLQTLFKNYLEANGWFVLRLNAGAIQATNKYGAKHMMRLAPAGTPDLMAFKKRVIGELKEMKTGKVINKIETNFVDLLFIEVKTPQNPTPTLMQTFMMNQLKEKGAEVIVAHSFEELEEYLKGGVK